MSEETDGQDSRAPHSDQQPDPQLEAAEELLRVVLGLTGGVIFEFNAEGRYLAIWTRSDELLAAPREVLLGRTIADVLGPTVAAPFLERIHRVLATQKPERFEYSLDVAGGLRWFSADALLVPQRQSVVFLVRDISHQKMLEQSLLQADRLAALGTLSAGVAHEVSNPLGYVTSNLNFASKTVAEVLGSLKKGEGGPDPAWLETVLQDCADALSEAREGTTRIRHVVSDLKTFARGADQGGGGADVRRALEAALNMARLEIRHRAQLVKHLEAVPPVRGSEARLGQVFLNLLLNAAQAIPEGAPDTNRVEVRLSAEDQWVVVELEDTGAGIPPELLKRIFDPFFSTKPAGVGTGLGLSICHGIVTEMGGEITVKSSVGQGTCFRVRLPIVDGSQSQSGGGPSRSEST
jgi:two-component system NtrC family sensor kinase